MTVCSCPYNECQRGRISAKCRLDGEPTNGADVLGWNAQGAVLDRWSAGDRQERKASKVEQAIKANLTRADVLNEAIKATKDRGVHYGEPEDNFARIARHWRVYFLNRFHLDIPALGSRDVALLMDLMKTARLENSPTHHDSWVDKAGYAACGAVIKEPVEQGTGREPVEQ